MAARNDITGDLIKSRVSSDKFNANWDAIFRKKSIPVESIDTEAVLNNVEEDVIDQHTVVR